MHRVWRDLERVDLNYYQEHLWVQMTIKNKGDVNIIGTGTFKVYAKEGGKLTMKDNLQMTVEKPNRVVLYRQEIPALTTIKIFDGTNSMLFHLISDVPVEIR